MRLLLKMDLPIEAKHGAKKGRVFKLTRIEQGRRREETKLWFVGSDGQECAAFPHECEKLTDECTTYAKH
jgi:hypothetical protein